MLKNHNYKPNKAKHWYQWQSRKDLGLLSVHFTKVELFKARRMDSGLKIVLYFCRYFFGFFPFFSLSYKNISLLG